MTMMNQTNPDLMKISEIEKAREDLRREIREQEARISSGVADLADSLTSRKIKSSFMNFIAQNPELVFNLGFTVASLILKGRRKKRRSR